MSDILSEKDILKILNIKDFRYLSKEHVFELASMIDKMDPQVAKKALSQFPHFSQVTQSAINEFRSQIDRMLSSNDEGVKFVAQSVQGTVDVLNSLLSSPNLSIEEREWIFCKISECHDRLENLESRNKHWLGGAMTVAATVTLGGVAVGAYVLSGGKIKVNPITLMGKK